MTLLKWSPGVLHIKVQNVWKEPALTV